MTIEAEQSVVGAILLEPDEAWPEVQKVGLRARHFVDDQLRAIYASVERLKPAGAPTDVVTVHAQLAGTGIAISLLEALRACVPSARNAGAYATMVIADARRRDAESAAIALQRAAASPMVDNDAFSARVQETLAVLQDCAAPLAPPSPPLRVELARDFGDEALLPAQLVEGLITVGGVSSVQGPANAGKTYFTEHLALCLSSGRDFLGRRTVACPVLYVAAEGAASVRARAQAARKYTGQEPGALAMVAGSFCLLEPSADVDALIGTAKALGDQFGAPVGLIVIDTLARVMAGGDENSAVDMGRAIAGADRLSKATGAHVLLIHHTGKDLSRGGRGHSSLKAALDTEIEVSVDDATKTHTAKISKQRDLPSKGEKLGFKLIPVELGFDQWGKPVTACAVEPSDIGIGAPAPRKLTAAQQAVMGYLNGCETGARRARIAEALEPQGVGRSSVFRAINELLNGGMVVEIAGAVYLPREG